MAKKQFKAESKRLLDLMIHSIYTHREIFLREIISNGSDAMDKLAYTALTDDKIALDRENLYITLTADKEQGTLTISDRGIGMSKEELEENLGTICKSGSLGFKEEMEPNEEIDIIGQFGVGFYAAFMVASKVTVITKKYNEDTAWKWVSDGCLFLSDGISRCCYYNQKSYRSYKQYQTAPNPVPFIFCLMYTAVGRFLFCCF